LGFLSPLAVTVEAVAAVLGEQAELAGQVVLEAQAEMGHSP
jgi:hypothetical protein